VIFKKEEKTKDVIKKRQQINGWISISISDI